MLPAIHRLSFRKAGRAFLRIAANLSWRYWILLRARPLLFVGLVLLWGGLFVSWKIKVLAVPGKIVWVTGFILWIIGMRPRKG